jgi:nucleoid-associated protein YgaU
MAINKAQLASELVGLGPGGGGLEKLAIRYTDGRGKPHKVEALFNPSEISITRSVTYVQKRPASKGAAHYFGIEQELTDIGAATLSIELFFDTYESRSDAGTWRRAASALLPPANPFQTGDATDVRYLTGKVAELALPDRELHYPPRCNLSWGRFDIFDGVLIHLDQRFTMFLNDGTPVRATLSCTFAEHTVDPYLKGGEQYSADVTKTRVVRRNDSLQSIAAEEYGDPSLWRLIARANGIVNPRDPAPGTVLMIPQRGPQDHA